MSTFNINTTNYGFAGPEQILSTGSVSPEVATTNQPGFQNIDNRQAMNPTSRFDSGIYGQQKYNEQLHEVDLYLENSGDFDNPKRFHINPAAVIGLVIRDTVNDWVADGYMTFMYFPTEPPSVQKTKTGQPKNTQVNAAIENGKVLRNYQFRGDGFDLLRIMIAPKSAPQGKNDPFPSSTSNSITTDKSDTKWVLSYLFSVYDIEDVNDIPTIQGPLSTYIKCLRLKFHDVRYQILKTTNLEYSVSDNPRSIPTSSGNYVLETGEAMADILNKALSRPETGGCDEFAVDANSPNWDKGSSKLFYTSPAQYSAYEDLQYLYSHHVSLKPLEGFDAPLNDLCLFHTDRPTSYGLLEPLVLTPISEIFKKAGTSEPGDLQKEHFFVTTHTSEDHTGTFRAPMGKGSDKNKDLKTFKYGQIVSYSFVDMSPDANSTLLTTTPVYSVDIGKRVFNVQFKNNDVITARKAIAKSYISHLFKEGTDEEKLFLPTIHKTKKDLNVFPTFTLNGEESSEGQILRQKNTFHQLLYTGLFQNACICFKTLGLTYRESGTFIGIDRTDGCADNDYNNKLYGQWFVVKVDHIFESGTYMNVIYAVKLHRYKEMSSEFKATIDNPQ